MIPGTSLPVASSTSGNSARVSLATPATLWATPCNEPRPAGGPDRVLYTVTHGRHSVAVSIARTDVLEGAALALPSLAVRVAHATDTRRHRARHHAPTTARRLSDPCPTRETGTGRRGARSVRRDPAQCSTGRMPP